MYFRFGVVVVTIVALALAGISVEKRNLALRRAISLQEYRRQQLQKIRSRLRLQIEQKSSLTELLNRKTATSSRLDPQRR